MSNPLVFGGTANPALAKAISELLGSPLGRLQVERFPDGELQVELGEDVRGRETFLVQPTAAPVGERLLELALLADALRRSGARRITAVVPYFGYARQDRRETGREPLGARVVADWIAGSVDRVVAMDLHSSAVEGCFRLPLEHVSAVEVLARRLGGAAGQVVVSPDMGAVKLAERYARLLGLPVAVVHKHRVSGAEVSAHGVVGEVKGLRPLVVDDMISTGGTVAAAIEVLLSAGCAPEVTVAATHGLFVGPSVERLRGLPLRRVVTTDTVPPPSGLPLPIEVVSVAGVFAEAVRRLSQG